MAPRQLSPDDQRLSDRAVDAASRADLERRSVAHRVAAKLAWSSPDEVAARLERASLYAAYLLLRHESGAEPPDAEVRKVGERLTAIHHRHEEIVAANREDADGMG
jgi:hypothetical protein